jgi:hypothetical protein
MDTLHFVPGAPQEHRDTPSLRSGRKQAGALGLASGALEIRQYKQAGYLPIACVPQVLAATLEEHKG